MTMTTQREKEIETLRSRLASLEEQLEREKQQQETLDRAREQLQTTLEEAGLNMEAFIRSFIKEFRRVVNRIEREQSKEAAKNKPAPTKSRKKVVKKKRKRRVKAKTTLKIPAGRYSNIPAEPEKVFEVREKGARPKVLKAYAEEVGLEAFLSQCRLPDENV